MRHDECGEARRDRGEAITDSYPWRDPPVVKENLATGKWKPPLTQTRRANAGGWDDWDNGGSSPDIRSRSTGDFRRLNGAGVPTRSRWMEDITQS
ncbi:hypothetical protein LR48_Vigan03g143400 [Vigna angularis]|uniref:Uncharacterized protein n=1 Tax=Phaseolus angularis TaxID=3914 RepID=A0A0L9U5X4_PHAAN|nr:hypothetical protein LR48_Vigan03g143400 [Vigna angularis]